MKNNVIDSKFYWLYLAGFFIISALPILTVPPWFFPADWGKGIMFRSVMSALLFLFIFRLLYKKKQPAPSNLRRNHILLLLAGLFVVYLLASIFSVDARFSFWGSPYRGGGFITFAFYFVFAVLGFLIIKKEDWQKLFDFSILIGLLVSAVGIIQYYGVLNSIFAPVSGRPPSTLGNPIILGTYVLILFFITVFLGLTEGSRWKKVLYFLSTAILLFTILITGSRAAYLGLAVGIIYFFLFYPRKSKSIKIAVAILLVIAAATLIYVNAAQQFPKFLQDNRLFNSIQPRLSINLLLKDPRFAAWQVDLETIKSKPLLGYGPENFSVGFDKYYNPAIPEISMGGSNWWDKAHNVLMQTASDAGILAAIIYLALFVVLIWKLQKIKRSLTQPVIAHGLQTALIAYFVDNLFNIDSFSTYILFFFIIAYTLHLTAVWQRDPASLPNQRGRVSLVKIGKRIIMGGLFLVLIIFLWQYNLVPLQVNAQLNKATTLARQKNCDVALAIMDSTLKSSNFLYSYVRTEYVENTKICSDYYPQNNLTYIKKGLELLQEAVKVQPLYTRYWIAMGTYADSIAASEQDLSSKNSLLNDAKSYLAKASELSPGHQEIVIEQARNDMISGNYQQMKADAEKCINLYEGLGDCYFYRALSKIYLKDASSAQDDLNTAYEKTYGIYSKTSLDMLADAYASIPDYPKLIGVFKNLIDVSPNVAQYHSSLAFFYSKTGDYANARAEALKVLELSPESKPNVDAFLKTLPY